MARALWITGRRTAELRDEALAEPGPGEVRVRATWSGVSRGTERLVLEGRVPAEEAAAMRAPFQAGDFPWPVKYGYASVGVVEAGVLPAGTRTFCLFPHQEAYVVPADAVVPLPDAVPSPRAVLAANLETAVNAAWDGAVGPGDRVAVVGAGVVGALVGYVCGRIPGVEVELVDPADRSGLARALGVGFASPGRAAAERDVVFHASATADGLATAIGLAGVEARVIELSWYGAGAVQAPLGGAFHARRLALVGSQVGRVPAARAPRWTTRRRLALAVSLLADPALDALLDEEVPFEALPLALPGIVDRARLCARVRYG